VGRYYAMDRDKRWERIQKVYDLLVHGKGTPSQDLVASLKASYENNITDEFVEPHFLSDQNQNPVAPITADDVVVFFNFRTDRGRELTEVLSQKAFPEFQMEPLPLHYVTLTNYDESYEGVRVIFDKDNLTGTLGETLSKAGKTQVRIAETEKYPHVTFFFNGGRETPFEGEDRILCPSPKVATYDLQPEMSAPQVRDAIVERMQQNPPDFICLNFANPDMVGHTGDLQAAIKACETVDQCAKAVVETALEKNYACLIIADHGNCETMRNPDGSPNTAHTTNPVPIILVDAKKRKLNAGVLANVAPTLLELMGVAQPDEMNAKSLLQS
jgi:2,3-bisphosphoglycerate-independent phosphoglycerate mutase